MAVKMVRERERERVTVLGLVIRATANKCLLDCILNQFSKAADIFQRKIASSV